MLLALLIAYFTTLESRQLICLAVHLLVRPLYISVNNFINNCFRLLLSYSMM